MSLVSSAAAVTVGGLNMAVYVVAWDRRVGSAASPFVELEATPSETSLKGIYCLAASAAGKRRTATLDVTGNVDIG